MKKSLILISILVLSGLSVFVYLNSKKSADAVIENSTTVDTANEPTKKSSFTLEEVSMHKDAASCWTVVENKVYDLTSMVNKHKGGAENILSLCGKDGTSAFSSTHGDQPKPNTVLKSLLIGDVLAGN